MPRYYFDVLDDGLFMDDEGIEFLDAPKVRTETLRTLPEMAKHRADLEGGPEVSITVRDEVGRPVLPPTLTIVARRLADAA